MKTAVTALWILLFTSVAHAGMVSGTYLSTYTGQLTQADGSLAEWAHTGRLILDGAGNATWLLNNAYGNRNGSQPTQCSGTGTYTETSDGQLTLQIERDCAPLNCVQRHGVLDCPVGETVHNNNMEFFCFIGGAELDCTQVGVYVPGMGLYDPVEAERWIKVSE
jgi:hypothetical protein